MDAPAPCRRHLHHHPPVNGTPVRTSQSLSTPEGHPPRHPAATDVDGDLSFESAVHRSTLSPLGTAPALTYLPAQQQLRHLHLLESVTARRHRAGIISITVTPSMMPRLQMTSPSPLPEEQLSRPPSTATDVVSWSLPCRGHCPAAPAFSRTSPQPDLPRRSTLAMSSLLLSQRGLTLSAAHISITHHRQ